MDGNDNYLVHSRVRVLPRWLLGPITDRSYSRMKWSEVNKLLKVSTSAGSNSSFGLSCFFESIIKAALVVLPPGRTLLRFQLNITSTPSVLFFNKTILASLGKLSIHMCHKRPTCGCFPAKCRGILGRSASHGFWTSQSVLPFYHVDTRQEYCLFLVTQWLRNLRTGK